MDEIIIKLMDTHNDRTSLAQLICHQNFVLRTRVSHQLFQRISVEFTIILPMPVPQIQRVKL